MYAEPDVDWTEWLTANFDAQEPIKLAALREHIAMEARRYVRRGDVTAEWVNKKLPALGVTDLVASQQHYELTQIATGTTHYLITASSRVEAEKMFRARIAAASVVAIEQAFTTGDPVFVSGPADPDVSDWPQPDPDSPTTTQGTLDKLRELLLLGVIAGPKFCESGLNPVLRSFGLAPVPARTQYVVTRPATATLRTVVEAFDEASAERVAGWRWDNGRAGYEVAEAEATDGLSVDVN